MMTAQKSSLKSVQTCDKGHIAPIVSGAWASFIVYVVLFAVVLIVCHKELSEEWNDWKAQMVSIPIALATIQG